ncbi:MAG: 30S ribosome-binding factor RbfA [Pseudomonadota bacterium]|nr:30S ribosome-binding factor RbfA [Pseudomonadota bacterium]
MAEKEPSQRQLRVGQEIKKIIANQVERDEIRNLQGVNTLVTIMEVRVSPDLKYATVYVITSDKSKEQEVIGGLQLAANYLRKVIISKTDLRYVPELNFRIDKTFEEVDKIEKLLRNPKVRQDLDNKD